MAIEVALPDELDIVDECVNERGIKDFGYWEVGYTKVYKPRFISMCRSCYRLKNPAMSAGDGLCVDCTDQ